MFRSMMSGKGFYNYIHRQPELSKEVNILNELRRWWQFPFQRRAPVLLIDLWAMASHIHIRAGDFTIVKCVKALEDNFATFLGKLRDAGAELVFVFNKSNDIETDINKIDFLYELRLQGMLILSQVAKRFGMLCGMDSTSTIRASTFHIQLANELGAMAILSFNSHYIFNDYPWAFWSTATMNLSDLTVHQYNKQKIMSNFNLTTQAVPLFATLTGGLLSTSFNIATTLNFFQTEYNHGKDASWFLKDLSFPISDEDLKLIISIVFGKYSDELFNDFKLSIRSFDPKENMKLPSKIDPAIRALIKNDVSNIAEEILDSKTIFISASSLSWGKNDVDTLVIPFIRKTAGMLLKHTESPQLVRVMQRSLGGTVELMECKPIIPHGDFARLSLLVSGNLTQNHKLSNLLWLSGLPLTFDELHSVPASLMLDFISCLHLFRLRALKLWEAECLLRSIIFARLSLPTILKCSSTAQASKRVGSLIFAFTKIFQMLHSCLAAVGLKVYQSDLVFDEQHFQSIYAEKSARKLVEPPLYLKEAFERLQAVIRMPFVEPEEAAENEPVDLLRETKARMMFITRYQERNMVSLCAIQEIKTLSRQQKMLEDECMEALAQSIESPISKNLLEIKLSELKKAYISLGIKIIDLLELLDQHKISNNQQ